MPIEAQSSCVNCNGKNFTRDEHLLTLVEIDTQGNVIQGGRTLPVVPLACNDCGTLRLFQAQIAGAV